MSAKYFRNGAGAYLGAFVDGAVPPVGAIEVPSAPAHAAQVWDGAKWAGAIPVQRDDADAIRQALIRKGTLTAAEIDAEKTR